MIFSGPRVVIPSILLSFYAAEPPLYEVMVRARSSDVTQLFALGALAWQLGGDMTRPNFLT